MGTENPLHLKILSLGKAYWSIEELQAEDPQMNCHIWAAEIEIHMSSFIGGFTNKVLEL